MTNRQWLLNQMQNMSDEELGYFSIKQFICKNYSIIKCRENRECNKCRIDWLNTEHKEQIKLSDVERVFLENVDKDYKWIARDKSGAELKVYTEKPIKKDHYWHSTVYKYITPFNHLFQFITWNDSEPYNIAELLKGE